MKSIIIAAVLLTIIASPLTALAASDEDAFNSMYKAKYGQLMAMPYIKKAAECLGGWTVINSDSILFKYAAWHTEKLTNMIIEDKSISTVEAKHRIRAMKDFSKYFPDGVSNSEIARIRQEAQFSRLILDQCSINTETGKLRKTPHKSNKR